MIQARAGSRIAPILLWMTGAVASFVVAALAVRALTREFNVFEIGAIRTGVGVVLLTSVLVLRPSLRAELARSDALSHIPRNVVHAAGGILWTMAIAALPFATVFSLEFTAPAWVALLAYPLLRERVRPRAVTGIAACIAGVLIIMRPGLGTVDPAIIYPLAAAFCFGLSVVLTRRLVSSQSVFVILFWMMVLQFAFYFAGSLTLISGPVSIPSYDLWPAIPVLGLAGLGSQLCLSKALQIGEATTVIPLDFLRVPIIAGIGWAAYGEELSAWVFTGAAVIMCGIAYGLAAPRQQKDSPSNTTTGELSLENFARKAG